MKFHDRSTIDQLFIGELADKIQRFYLVNPDNLRAIQQATDEQVTKMGLPYRLRATIRRGKSGEFDKLHLVKRPVSL
jgi:hypothetical protein